MNQKRLVMVGIRRKGSKKFTIKTEGKCPNYLEKDATSNPCFCAGYQEVLREKACLHSKNR